MSYTAYTIVKIEFNDTCTTRNTPSWSQGTQCEHYDNVYFCATLATFCDIMKNYCYVGISLGIWYDNKLQMPMQCCIPANHMPWTNLAVLYHGSVGWVQCIQYSAECTESVILTGTTNQPINNASLTYWSTNHQHHIVTYSTETCINTKECK